jgi:hypothetical protein
MVMMAVVNRLFGGAGGCVANVGGSWMLHCLVVTCLYWEG